VSLLVLGAVKLVSTRLKAEKIKKTVSLMSVILNVFAVVFLALTREAYAVVVVFLLLAAKVLIGLKLIKSPILPPPFHVRDLVGLIRQRSGQCRKGLDLQFLCQQLVKALLHQFFLLLRKDFFLFH
jgi:hypothetical protein